MNSMLALPKDSINVPRAGDVKIEEKICITPRRIAI